MQILLCKVVLHAKGATVIATPQAMLAKIISGDYGQLPNGDIIEPLLAFATEAEANQERDKLVADDPDGDYRVVATFDEKELDALKGAKQ